MWSASNFLSLIVAAAHIVKLILKYKVQISATVAAVTVSGGCGSTGSSDSGSGSGGGGGCGSGRAGGRGGAHDEHGKTIAAYLTTIPETQSSKHARRVK